MVEQEGGGDDVVGDKDYDKQSASNKEDDNRDKFNEGKDPMSPQLYRSICHWLLECGTLEGIFAALFVVLTWNLVCCSNKTAQIRFSHLQWNVFDAMTVNFKHTKTDQHGDQKQKKGIFSPTPWNTSSICHFSWAFISQPASILTRQEANNFFLEAATIKPEGSAKIGLEC